VSDFTIDKDIPAPSPRRQQFRYPFAEMAPGNSFFFTPDARYSLESERHRIDGAAREARQSLGFRFTVRKVTERGVLGFRCWRLPDSDEKTEQPTPQPQRAATPAATPAPPAAAPAGRNSKTVPAAPPSRKVAPTEDELRRRGYSRPAVT